MDITAPSKWLIQSRADIARHEGFREFAYPDPLSKLGKKYQGRKWGWGFERGDVLLVKYGEKEEDGRPWTVGYGFTKGVKPSTTMRKPFADQKLSGVVADHAKLLDRLVPNWKALPLYAQTVLVNLAYNLGTRLIPFGPTMALFEAWDFKGAAARLRRTAWFKQVGDRSEELVRRLETGVIESKHRVV